MHDLCITHLGAASSSGAASPGEDQLKSVLPFVLPLPAAASPLQQDHSIVTQCVATAPHTLSCMLHWAPADREQCSTRTEERSPP